MGISGPYGTMFNFEEGETLALVGGGYGAAPLYFLAQTLKNRTIEFLAGFASSDSVILPDVALGLDLNISIATDNGTQGHSGFVTELLEKSIKSFHLIFFHKNMNCKNDFA